MSSPLLSRINIRMHGHGCPSEGCLGECPALTEVALRETCSGPLVLVTAALFIWDPQFQDSAAVAGWFTAEGATETLISHVLHDPFNATFNGQTEDHTRNWVVDAWFPPDHPSVVDLVEPGRAAPERTQ